MNVQENFEVQPQEVPPPTKYIGQDRQISLGVGKCRWESFGGHWGSLGLNGVHWGSLGVIGADWGSIGLMSPVLTSALVRALRGG